MDDIKCLMGNLQSRLQDGVECLIEDTDWDVRGTEPDFQTAIIEIKGSLSRLSTKLASVRSKFISQ